MEKVAIGFGVVAMSLGGIFMFVIFGTLLGGVAGWIVNRYGQRVEYPCASVQDCKTAAELLRRTVAETGEPVEREVSELVAYFRPGRIDQGVASRGEIIDEMASLIRRDTGILNGCADAAARSIAEMLTRAALAQPATAGEP